MVEHILLDILENIMERDAKFKIGEIVKHRFLSFRGVIFDVDPTFNNTEEWWLSIPEDMRPKKDQPFYHLLAENEEQNMSHMYLNKIYFLMKLVSQLDTLKSMKFLVLLKMVLTKFNPIKCTKGFFNFDKR